MSSVFTAAQQQEFLGYFEEPEPGVPDGCTGWYHTAGKFPLERPDQVFTFGPGIHSPIREEISGPFTCRDEALADLQVYLAETPVSEECLCV